MHNNHALKKGTVCAGGSGEQQKQKGKVIILRIQCESV